MAAGHKEEAAVRFSPPYLIVIGLEVGAQFLTVAADDSLGFGSGRFDGFHLSAKFRVLGVEVLITPY